MNPVEEAQSAAAAAARQSDQYALVLAAVQAAQIVQQQPQHRCEHDHQPRAEFDARKWLVIGGVGTVGALAFALASIAIAVGACCATACLIVLRSMWRHYLRNL
jgi:streptomycin 6-kinase